MELLDPYAPVEVASDFWMKPVLQFGNGELFCPGVDGPTYSDNPSEYVEIGGGAAGQKLKTPGLCWVYCRKEYGIDKKKPAGRHGATITVHGVDSAEIDIEVLLWTPEQWRQFKSLWAIVFPGNKRKQEARDVSHPSLAAHGVKSMIIVRGSGPDQGSIINSRVFTISGLEFAKVSKADQSVSPKGAKPIGDIYSNPHRTPGTNAANLGPRNG